MQYMKIEKSMMLKEREYSIKNSDLVIARNNLMIKVKIINGKAFEADKLKTARDSPSFWSLFFLNQFLVSEEGILVIPKIEGQYYWAWKLSKGQVVLIERVS